MVALKRWRRDFPIFVPDGLNIGAGTGIAILPEVDIGTGTDTVAPSACGMGFVAIWGKAYGDLFGGDVLRLQNEVAQVLQRQRGLAAAEPTGRAERVTFLRGRGTGEQQGLIIDKAGIGPAVSVELWPTQRYKLDLAPFSYALRDDAIALTVQAGALPHTLNVQREFDPGSSDLRFSKEATIAYLGPTAGAISIGAAEATSSDLQTFSFDSRHWQPGERGGGLPPRTKLRSYRGLPIVGGGVDGKSKVSLTGTLNPIDVLDGARSFFEVSAQPGSSAGVLRTGYLTTHGHSILVQPSKSATPRFTFTRFGRGWDSNNRGTPKDFSHSLTLEGDFDIVGYDTLSAARSVPPAPDSKSIAVGRQNFGLMLGLSPLEFVPIETAPSPAGDTTRGEPSTKAATPGLVMSFKRGAGLDPRYPAKLMGGVPEINDHARNVVLRGSGVDHTTSWVRVAPRSAGAGAFAETQGLSVVAEDTDYATLSASQRPAAAGAPNFEHTPLLLITRKDPPAEPGTPALPQGYVPAFPHFAALGEDTDRKNAAQYEIDQLALERRKLLVVRPPGGASSVAIRSKAAAAVPGAADPIRSNTPIGFMVEYDEATKQPVSIVFGITQPSESSDKKIRFALTRKPATGTPSLGSSFDDVLNALTRNRLFMVINAIPPINSGPGAKSVELEAEVVVAGWTFRAQIEGWPPQGEGIKLRPDTYIIVKGYPGKSIRQLFDEPAAWTGRWDYLKQQNGSAPPADDAGKAKYVEGAVSDAQKFLKERLHENCYAPGGSLKSPAYKRIVEVLNDADWAGVIVANADLVPAGLPDQIKGLMGGVKPDLLRAHHVAIEVRKLDVDPKKPADPQPFALVDYPIVPTPPDKGKAGDYGFWVETLRALFANGELQAFDAKVGVRVPTLFEDAGEIVPRDGSLDKGEFYLKGAYEARYEGGKRLETYSFFAEKTLIFKPDSLIFEQINLDRIGYITRQVGKPGPTGMAVNSSLVFDGAVKFKKLQGFDLTDIESVKFSDLAIDLKFNLPLAGKLPDFSFAPGNLSLNFGAPSAGPGRGIFRSLPVKFRSFNFWGNGIKLPDLGFFKLGPSAGDKSKGLKYGLGFELDLGSLGKLAEKIKAFKLNFVLGFSGGGSGGAWDVGFKIEGGGGEGLELGLESVLKLKADSFQLQKVSAGGKEQYAIAALGARLYVFNQAFPEDKDGTNLNLFLFADPTALGDPGGLPASLGWFAVRVGNMDYDSVRLDAIALGQKVDPFVGTLGTTRSLLDYVQYTLGGKLDPGNKNQTFDKIASLIKQGTIRYDRDRDWAIAFRSLFFKQVFIDFVMSDPALYGIRVDVKLLPNPKDSNAASFLSLDVLYRRLTEELGVYSVEFVPPPTWRQIDFGAVAVTIPAIGLEIYTDGGFNVDLGYPRNHDFSRAFAVNVGPFLGSGGFYFGRVSGPGAKLVPQPKFRTGPPDPKRLRYDPVTQIGLGARVGLGREILKGPLRAGLSLTIFGYLEGAYGVLYAKDPADLAKTDAARTYTVLAGSIGIMGEVYGYVDFGIVKAGVSIRVWVAYGLTIATHRRTRVYVEAGVEVYVEVVIARFRVFGATIEIRISFSFSTTLDFSVYVGSDGPDAYGFSSMMVGDILALRPPIVSGREGRAAIADRTTKIDWGKLPAVAQWRVGGAAQKLPLPLVFSPDVTIVGTGGATPLAEAVMLLMLESRAAGSRAPVSPFEELMRGLAAWLLTGALSGSAGFDPKDFLAWPIGLDHLERIAERLDAPPTDPAALRERVPDYAQIVAFLQQGTATTIGLGKATDAAHVMFPMPPDVRLVRRGFADIEYNGVDLARMGLVTDAYRVTIDRHFAELILLLRQRDNSRPSPFVAEAGSPLAQALFEENFGLLLRSAAEKLRRIWLEREAANKLRDKAGSTAKFATVAELLDDLSTPPTSGEARASPAAEAGAFASRFFLHGLALPYPVHAGATPNIPPLLRTAKSPQPLYRLAWLQLPLGDRQAGATWTVGIEQGAWTWGQVDAGTEGSLMADSLNSLDGAINDLLTKPELLPQITAQPGMYGTFMLREVAAPRPLPLVDRSTTPPRVRQLVLMPTEVRRLAAAQSKDQTVSIDLCGRLATGKQGTDVAKEEVLSGTFAIAIEIAIRRIQSAKGFVANIVEIGGARETDRLLLDLFADPDRPDQVINVDLISAVSLFKPTDNGYEELMPAAKDKVVLVQANLSTEARPDDANFFAIAVQKAVESGQAFQPVRPFATLNDWGSFVELIRRASIVKTGGYYLGYAGADGDLASLFAAGNGDKLVGPEVQPRLLLVVELKGTSQYANPAKAANAMVFDPKAFSTDKVYGFRTGAKNFAGGHEPGVEPVSVNRRDPNALYAATIDGKQCKGFEEVQAALRKKYPNDERRVTRELVALGSARIELLQRFTMLDYCLRDVDNGDKVLVEASDVLPFQPTMDRSVSVAPDQLQYRLSLPVSQALERAAKAPGGPSSPTNAYKLVGRKFCAEFGWRDIYGNPWPFGTRHRHEFKVTHSDRLIPISDLLHLVYDAKPTTKPRSIAIRMELDGETIGKLDHVDDQTTPPLPAWLEEQAARFRNAKPTYLRAADQYEGTGITAAITTSLAGTKDDPGLKLTAKLGEIAAVLRDIASAVGELSTLFTNAQTKGWNRSQISAEIKTLLSRHKKLKYEVELTFANVPLLDFIEIKAEIVIQRDTKHLPEGWGVGKAVSLKDCGDVWNAVVPLAFAPPDVAAGVAAGDALKDLAAKLAVTMPGFLLATGYGPVAGVKDQALWLVREALLPTPKQTSGKPPNVLALTPLATTLKSFELDQLPVFDPSNQERRERRDVRDVDVDVLARTALARIERVLAPDVGPALATRAPAASMSPEAVGASLERIAASKAALAQGLAKRLEPVFRDAMPPADLAKAQRLLTDRLRRRLTDAYAIDAVLVYPEIMKPDKSVEGFAPQAFGRIPPVAGGSSELAVEPGNLDLSARSAGLVATCDARGTAGNADSGSPWFNLPDKYTIAHVQRSRPGSQPNRGTDGPNQNRYRAEAWLRLVNPRTVDLPAAGNAEPVVPVVLRAVPVKPIVAGQQWQPDSLTGSTQSAVIGSARSWSYEADWIWAPEVQDRLRTATAYNSWPAKDTTRAAFLAAAALEWPERFARFEASTGAAFEKILAEAGQASLSLDTVKALSYFADRCVELARDVPQWAAFLGPAEVLTDRFVFREDVDGTKRKIGWTYIDANGVVAPLPTGTAQRNPRSFSIRAINLDDTKLGALIEITSNDGSGLIDPAEVDETAARLRRRRLKVKALDILDMQAAWFSVSLSRNEAVNIPSGGGTRSLPLRESFVYRLAEVRAGEPVTPLIRRNKAIDVARSAATLEKQLADFMRDALASTRPAGAVAGAMDLFVWYDNQRYDGLLTSILTDQRRRSGVFIDSFPSVGSGDAGAIATRISTWINSLRVPARRAANGRLEGALILDARVYSILPQNRRGQPILWLQNCIVPCQNVSNL